MNIIRLILITLISFAQLAWSISETEVTRFLNEYYKENQEFMIAEQVQQNNTPIKLDEEALEVNNPQTASEAIAQYVMFMQLGAHQLGISPARIHKVKINASLEIMQLILTSYLGQQKFEFREMNDEELSDGTWHMLVQAINIAMNHTCIAKNLMQDIIDDAKKMLSDNATDPAIKEHITIIFQHIEKWSPGQFELLPEILGMDIGKVEIQEVSKKLDSYSDTALNNFPVLLEDKASHRHHRGRRRSKRRNKHHSDAVNSKVQIVKPGFCNPSNWPTGWQAQMAPFFGQQGHCPRWKRSCRRGGRHHRKHQWQKRSKNHSSFSALRGCPPWKKHCRRVRKGAPGRRRGKH